MSPVMHSSPTSRRSLLSLVLGFLVVFMAFGMAQRAAADDLHPKLDPALEAALDQATDAESVPVIVTATSSSKYTVMRAHVVGTGKPVKAEHKFINALTAQLGKNDVAKLESDQSVGHMSLDQVVSSTGAPPATPGNGQPTVGQPGGGQSGGGAPGQGVRPIPIDDVMLATLGLTNSLFSGKGVGVAILDSGLQPSTDIPSFSFTDYTTAGKSGSPYDDYGHGTHVAGLIRATYPIGGNPIRNGVIGVADGVRLINMKVLDGAGRGYTSTVLTALEAVLNNKASFSIDVVNLSLGHPISESLETDPLVQAVEALSHKGLIVVVAAGNLGINPSTGLAAYAGITSPGNAPSALTVGAIDINQTVSRSDDQVPVYSSRGPTWYDGLVKPDIVAPGVSLVSLAAIGSSLYNRYPELRVNDATGNPRFMRLSGTSMATAVATGVVALLIEERRQFSTVPLTPNDVKAVLQFTAIPVNGADVLTQGAGAINPAGALAVIGALTGSADPSMRSTTEIQPTTMITFTSTSETYAWSRTVIWGHTCVYGDTIYANEPAWASQTTWGSTVVWGHSWAASGDLVWDSAPTWSANTVWDPTVAPSTAASAWPELDGQARTVIWGHGGPY